MEIDNPPRNIEKGIRNLERAANQGLTTAQATLGMIYFTGIGVPRDPKEQFHGAQNQHAADCH